MIKTIDVWMTHSEDWDRAVNQQLSVWNEIKESFINRRLIDQMLKYLKSYIRKIITL